MTPVIRAVTIKNDSLHSEFHKSHILEENHNSGTLVEEQSSLSSVPDSSKSEDLVLQVVRRNEDSDCKIVLLNDDCLAHIFSYLSPKELIIIERVCKWWQYVSRECWRTVKEVSVKDLMSNNRSYTIPDEILECILKRCGKYVERLIIEYRCLGLTLIPKYCTALQYLDVFNGIETSEPDPCMLTELQNLAVFRSDGGSDNIKVANLLKVFPKIQSLYICTVCPFGDNCLRSLDLKYLEELYIETHIMDLGHLADCCNEMQNLRSLTIFESIPPQKHFVTIIKSLPKVEHFSLPVNCPNGHKCSASFLSNRLASLNVEGSAFITDMVIEEIVNNCVNLESLNISDCKNITRKSISAISYMPCLKHLIMKHLRSSDNVDIVTDCQLQLLAWEGKLLTLNVRHNLKITDKGCAKVLSLCRELECFDLIGCPLITDATIVSAGAAVKHRTKDNELELLLQGTSVTKDSKKWNDLYPLLLLNFEHQCDGYCVCDIGGVPDDFVNDWFDTTFDSELESDIDTTDSESQYSDATSINQDSLESDFDLWADSDSQTSDDCLTSDQNLHNLGFCVNSEFEVSDKNESIDSSSDTYESIDGSSDTYESDSSSDTYESIDGSSDTYESIDSSSDTYESIDSISDSYESNDSSSQELNSDISSNSTSSTS